MEKLDWNLFKPKFGAWAHYFEPLFRDTMVMEEIYRELKEQSRGGEVICPDPINTFRSFELLHPQDVRVIFVLLDPYPQVKNNVKVATGIAMDCSNTNVLQPSLEKFYGALEETYCKDGMCLEMIKDPSLQYIVHQGVMFFNTALTVPQGKTGAHTELWEPFMKYFYTEVMDKFSGIVYVLAGKESQKMGKWIYPMANYIINVEHPSFAGRQYRPWKHDGLFKKIDYYMNGNNNEKIHWVLEPAPF